MTRIEETNPQQNDASDLSAPPLMHRIILPDLVPDCNGVTWELLHSVYPRATVALRDELAQLLIDVDQGAMAVGFRAATRLLVVASPRAAEGAHESSVDVCYYDRTALVIVPPIGGYVGVCDETTLENTQQQRLQKAVADFAAVAEQFTSVVADMTRQFGVEA